MLFRFAKKEGEEAVKKLEEFEEEEDHVKRIEYPADGCKAWSVVFACFLCQLTVLGMFYANGIFVVPFVEEFNTTYAEASLVGTVNAALFYFIGVFSG